MIRSFHRWFGLIAAVLLTTLAVSGMALSIFPVTEAFTTPPARKISVAELAARVQVAEPSVEQIRRAPSGRVTAYYFAGSQPASAVIDPATGKPTGTADTSALQRWLTSFHRSLLLDDAGRIVTASGAGVMLLIFISGFMLLARRAGGWRLLLQPQRGSGSGRRHATISRLAMHGLLLSSLTALWMSAGTFGLLPENAGAPPFPTKVSGVTGVAIASVPLLVATPVNELRSLSFPAAGDLTDVYTLKTVAGEGYIDQGNGALLSWSDAGWIDRVSSFISMLHTGQGMAWLGVLLALSALCVPVLGWTGLSVWLAGRRDSNVTSVPAGTADTILLVASEGGTTRGFATTLQMALAAQGARVHVGPMTGFDPARWPKAHQIMLLAATYGDGAAPASASGFLSDFQRHPAKPGLQLAVLGFGDRSFPSFCGFAAEIARVADEKGWSQLLPFDTVERQSPQDFARWGRDLAKVLGMDFELNHHVKTRKTWAFSLVSRRDYGENLQAMTSILRFALPKTSIWQRLFLTGMPRFEAGDLIGVLPEGSDLPRLYSLASGSRDGFVEICVRKQAGGLCSGQLTALQPGDTVTAFLQPNPCFRPTSDMKPVILIGAGTGIGPLAGFVRANRAHRPMHLYFGARHPASDALYAEELSDWTDDGRLTSVSTAFSRTPTPAYVQDILRQDATRLGRCITSGGQVLVCGGRDMAAGVADAISDILAPLGLSVAKLKSEGRYAEDVY